MVKTSLKSLLQTSTAVVAVGVLTVTATTAFAADSNDPDISAGVSASGASVASGESFIFDDAARNEGGTGENSLDDNAGAAGVTLDVDNVTLDISNGVNLESLDATNDSAVVNVTAGQGGTGTVINVASGSSITGVADGDAINIAATGQATVNVSGTVTTSGGGVAINASGAATTGVVGGINITGGTVSSAGTAIDISGDTSASNITINDGTVTGNIVLGGTAADTINITGTNGGSTIAGTITGDSAVGFTLDVDANFTAGGNITDLTTLDVETGDTFTLGNNQIDSTGVTLAIQGAGTTDITGFTGTAVAADTVTLANGSTLVVDADSTINGDITTAGAVSGSLVMSTDGAGDTLTIQNGASFNNSISGGDDNTQDVIDFAIGDANTIALGASSTISNFATLDVSSGGVSATGNINVGAVTINGTAGTTELNVAGNTSGSLTTDNGITITSGTLTTGASTTIASNIALDTTNGHLNGAVQFDNGGRQLTVTGDGSGNGANVDAITGGSAADTISITMDAVTDSFSTNGAIDLAGGSDVINVRQGNFNVGHDVTAETTTLGAAGGASLTVAAGTYTGNVAANAGANNNTVNVTGGTIVGNVDLSAATGGTGTINLTSGDISGTITGSANAANVFNVQADHTTRGTIADVESINLNGGDLTVASGHTITDVDTALSIAAGDTLTANGNVTGTGALTWDGTINVGSTNVLTMATASAAAGASATYIVNVAGATSASQVVLSGGGIDFTNGTVTVNNTAGYVADGTSWTIIDGAGATSATAAAGSDTSALVTYSVSNDGTGNDLVLTLNRTGYGDVSGLTGSASAAGASLNTLGASATGDLATIQAQLDSMDTTTEVQNALESLTPSTDAGVANTSIAVQTGSLNTVTSRLASLRSASATGIATGDAAAQRSFWVEAFGNSVDQDDRGGEKGFEANTYGLTIGADSDAIAAGYNIGVAASYGKGDVDSDSANNASTDINSYQLTGYLSREKLGAQELFLNAMVSVAYNDYESSRQVAVGGFTNTASADYNGMQYGARVEIGKDYFVEAAKTYLTPVASVQYSHLNLDSYTETGAGGANLTVNPEDVNTIDLALGVEASRVFELNNGGQLVPEARIKYLYSAGDTDMATTSTFAGGGNAFKTTGVDISRSGGQAGLGVTYKTPNGVELSANYDAEMRSDYFGHSAQLRFRYRF